MSDDDEAKKKSSILKKLDHYVSEDYDQIIVDYLVNGYTDVEKAKSILRKRDEHYRLNNINEEHRTLWSQYHSNFTTPQDVFIANQIRFLRDHIDDLNIRDVVQAVNFIRELDPLQAVDELLDRSIELFAAKVEPGDRKWLNAFRLDSATVQRVQEKLAHKSVNFSMQELFVALAGSNSWNPKDIQHLIHYSDDDYFHWITTEKDHDVIELLVDFLARFGQQQNADEVAIISRVRSALERVKERSDLDRFRVEYLIEGKKH